jgi:hypothetical protein
MYQIFSSPHAKEWGLTWPENFRYLRLSGCTQVTSLLPSRVPLSEPTH